MNDPVTQFRIGALLFPKFELLDLYGPLEFLGNLGPGVSITMIAEAPGAIHSTQGPKGVADLALAEVADLDLLLVPGGWGTRSLVENDSFLQQLKRVATQTKYVASVCTGSALLARAGILDGRSATSNKRAFDWAMTQGPRVNWVRQARWVEDGNLFTSSGVSAGMDMTLGLIQHIFGRAKSLELARNAECTWHEDRTSDPFA
jgi:putative intracellular protease/amidase